MFSFHETFDTLNRMIETNEPLFSESEMERLSRNRFVVIRSLAAEALGEYPASFATPILNRMLTDSNSGVRSSAAIGISKIHNLRNDKTFLLLKDAFEEDTDPLVRGYSGYAFIKGYCGKGNVVKDVESILRFERNFFVKALSYSALYSFLNQKWALDELISCFRSRNYRTRCAVANILSDILDKENAEIIYQAAQKALKKETEISVISSLSDLIDQVEKVL